MEHFRQESVNVRKFDLTGNYNFAMTDIEENIEWGTEDLRWAFRKELRGTGKLPRRLVNRIDPKGLSVEDCFLGYLSNQNNDVSAFIQIIVCLTKNREPSIVFFTQVTLGGKKIFIRLSWFEYVIRVTEYVPYVSENESGNIEILSIADQVQIVQS